MYIDGFQLSPMLISGCFRFSSLMRRVHCVKQVTEFDVPTDVITHTPTPRECFPFHLAAFLSEAPPNPVEAAQSDGAFCNAISDASGVRVWTVREILRGMSTERFQRVNQLYRILLSRNMIHWVLVESH
jgi:hypothetical protein